jgi:hypothetical protein
MKTFEEYLDKMGYGWNDFDRTYEMENLIEQYADERIKQALRIPVVSHRRELLLAFYQHLLDNDPFPIHSSAKHREVDRFLKANNCG